MITSLTFILIFSYIIQDLYFNIINIFIENQTIKLIILFLAYIISICFIIIIPLFLKNSSKSFYHFIYVFLCILISVFCFLVLKDIILIFKKDTSFSLILLIFILFLITFCFYGYSNNKIKITKYNLDTDKKINSKIIFISDLHIGNKGINEKQIKKIVSIINNENPDLLLFGGDLVENEQVFEKTKNYTKIIQGIKTKNIYGILGNHEFYSNNNINNITLLLNNNYGINILQDEIIKFGKLIIIGRTDLSSKKSNTIKRKNLTEIINSIDNIDKNYFLVLDHNPIEFIDSVNNNIDLQLSGHTHGGQFFPFNLINRLFYGNYNYGVYKKNNSKLIVSSGIGTSGIPLRVFTKKEIVIVNIREKK